VDIKRPPASLSLTSYTTLSSTSPGKGSAALLKPRPTATASIAATACIASTASSASIASTAYSASITSTASTAIMSSVVSTASVARWP
jgi:hypothetical protein